MSDSSGVPGILGPNAFILEHRMFDSTYINHSIPLNNIEIWEIKSSSIFAHPFHIHDVEFYILERNGAAPPSYEQGWKDVVLVKGSETVKFIAKFDDYADALHPFMYHCHIALHEDEGMMGQFVVEDQSNGTEEINTKKGDFTIFPNPSNKKIFIRFADPQTKAYYIKVFNAVGRTIYMLPRPELENGIDVSSFAPGIYYIELTDESTKQISSKKFVVN
jgi:hypothetical protein